MTRFIGMRLGAAVVTAALAAASGGTARAATVDLTGIDLDRTKYVVVDNFGPKIGTCSYGSPNRGSQVGVSAFTVSSREISYAVGSIQVLLDDGRGQRTNPVLPECQRRIQVFNATERITSGADEERRRVEGISSVLLSLNIETNSTLSAPAFCTSDAPCQWSNAYIKPTDPSQCELNRDCPITTGQYTQNAIKVITEPVLTGCIDNTDVRCTVGSEYLANLFELSGDPLDKIQISQRVYVYPNKPYFDVSWRLGLAYNASGLPNLSTSFWYALDTYTSGVDFGFGYTCSANGLCGATGGSAFFQGMQGLNPPTQALENNWAVLFDQIARRSVTGPSDPRRPLVGTGALPLRNLIDNGMLLEWRNVVLNNTLRTSGDTRQTYLALRWTFDDPIRQNTFALAQSLFAVGIWDENGRRREVVVDVQTRPNEARTELLAYANPVPCKGVGTSECTSGTCLANPYQCPVEVPGDPCPRFCADSICDDTDPTIDPMTICGTGRACLFGYCLPTVWRATDTLVTGGNDRRKMFTIDTSVGGTRYNISAADSGPLEPQMKVDLNDNGLFSDGETSPTEPQQAKNILEWVRGTASLIDDPATVIRDNGDQYTDLLNTPLLRRRRYRYGAEDQNFVLGEVTSGQPAFVGPRALNPAYLANQDKIASAPKYKDFINGASYKNRPRVVFLAAQDGMIHAFSVTASGAAEELWAFMPWEVLPKLKDYASPYYQQTRTPMLDFAPLVQDVYDATSGQWRTVLIFGMKAGGTAYYAFDITYVGSSADPTQPDAGLDRLYNPRLLWRVAADPTNPSDVYRDLGRTFGKPTIMRLQRGSGEVAAVVFGSGYAETAPQHFTKQAYIYAVSLFETDSLARPSPIATSPVVAGPLTDMNGQVLAGNAVMGATAVDENQDGYDDKAYVTDLAGNLWRLYVNLNDAGFSIQPLFRAHESFDPVLNLEVVNSRCAGSADCQRYFVPKYARPIASVPVPAFSGTDAPLGTTANNNSVVVMFGTGKFDSFYDAFDRFVQNPNEDAYANQQPYYQNLYGVVDRAVYATRTSAATLVAATDLRNNTIQTETSLNGQSIRFIQSGTAGCAADCKGWRIPLYDGIDANGDGVPDAVGERVVTDPVYFNKNMFVSTFVPNQQGTCDIRSLGTGAITSSNQQAGGGFLMAVDYRDGGNPRAPVLDTNRNGTVNVNDTVRGNNIAGLRFSGSVLSAPIVDPIGGNIYLKTQSDRPPIRIATAPGGAFRGTKTIYVRQRL